MKDFGIVKKLTNLINNLKARLKPNEAVDRFPTISPGFGSFRGFQL